jgi:hypothetical protein
MTVAVEIFAPLEMIRKERVPVPFADSGAGGSPLA